MGRKAPKPLEGSKHFPKASGTSHLSDSILYAVRIMCLYIWKGGILFSFLNPQTVPDT